MNYNKIVEERKERVRIIAETGGLDNAITKGLLPKYINLSLSEAIVMGLLKQDVKKYIGTFGHGSTELGEVLRVYEEAGLVQTYNVRNEVEAAHGAMALRWVTGEKAAVFTSIGPGALQAFSGSLAAASNGVGVWHIYGDETTGDEGPNMQQIPGNNQFHFLQLCKTMGGSYSLAEPNAITSALRKGINCVDHPYRAGPFYLLMPMNTQCSVLNNFNLEELPVGTPPLLNSASSGYKDAVDAIIQANRIVVKVGGGAVDAVKEIREFLSLVNGTAVTSPLSSGVIPYDDPVNMTVGGSKGSLCGNYAMENADLLVALGTRFVCQSDCSRTGYPGVMKVININADIEDAMHYNKTIPLLGDIKATLKKLNNDLRKKIVSLDTVSQWVSDCRDVKKQWEVFKKARYDNPVIFDKVWRRKVLTQPAAIKTAVDWAKLNNLVTFFDSGDVQANGFQIVEDDHPGRTFTETGASYMGWAVSALLATAMSDKPFYGVAMAGDGSFMMNPQILIDGVAHGVTGCIIVFDNRRMAAISSLQNDQYGIDYATNDNVEVDYAAMAKSIMGVEAFHGGFSVEEFLNSLETAKAYKGLSLIHVPVYYGPDKLGGMGVFGRWNVGNWCEDVQVLRHKIGL